MKKLIFLLALTGCQVTVQKLPDPVNPDLASVIQEHSKALQVLVDEYNLKHKKEQGK